ncbi:DUF5687 family protein [Phaeodactylibacter luteus]|uniref:Uncharacterized protein n=1 Tax=Phaeodactylibacter luteus TaxID=1564516 RepID=A0A5C6RKG8_9BACT|nr:DUF5687 family protein [Phaeodactylibacter luteus]TXB62399.1 hypothetical protein FRY97_14040 [Phaeodactylibacter luteus]
MIRSLWLQGWKAQLRSPFWERGLAINIILGLFALYLLLNFLALGYFLDVILAEAMPDEDPFRLLNRLLFYSWAGGLLMRFLMQSFPVLDIKPYLLLPLPRSRLFHYLLGRSALNVFNLFPLVFVLPFAYKTLPGAGPALAWSAGVMMLALSNNYLAFYLKRQFSISPLYILVGLLLLASLAWLDFKEVLPVSGYFEAYFSLLAEQPAALLGTVGLLALSYGLTYSALRKNAYLDTVEARRERVESSTGIAALRRLGPAGQFLEMELMNILRNRRPRTMLLMSIAILFYPFFAVEYLDKGSMSMAFLFILMATCFPMATYGQFLIAWESSFFGLLMSRKVSWQAYLQGKYYLFVLFNTVTFALCLLYGLVDWRMLPLVLVAFLVNLGLTAYIILYLSTYNTRAVDPEKGAFMNWEGVGASQFLLVLPAFFLPVVLHLLLQWVLGWGWGLAVLGALGLAGILLQPPLMARIAQQLASRKYILADHFKQDT